MSHKNGRLALHQKLTEILPNVYFQPPASISMEYPCIVYGYSDEIVRDADNSKYFTHDAYAITLITKHPLPDEEMSALSDLPYCRFQRRYTDDNLYHFAYSIKVSKGND